MLDDFGWIGRAWRETNEDATDRETLIKNLLAGEYNEPIRIVVFNTAEDGPSLQSLPSHSGDGWPDDVRLSDLEPRFVCSACGDRALVRPNWERNKQQFHR